MQRFRLIFYSKAPVIFEWIDLIKVIHSSKNLFCNVGHICNLVQEFNGLVSKGSIARLTLFLCLFSAVSFILFFQRFLIISSPLFCVSFCPEFYSIMFIVANFVMLVADELILDHGENKNSIFLSTLRIWKCEMGWTMSVMRTMEYVCWRVDSERQCKK